MARVQVRMLVPLGGHKAGDVVTIEDRPIPARLRTPGGPTTLIESYIAAGYAELA